MQRQDVSYSKAGWPWSFDRISRMARWQDWQDGKMEAMAGWPLSRSYITLACWSFRGSFFRRTAFFFAFSNRRTTAPINNWSRLLPTADTWACCKRTWSTRRLGASSCEGSQARDKKDPTCSPKFAHSKNTLNVRLLQGIGQETETGWNRWEWKNILDLCLETRYKAIREYQANVPDGISEARASKTGCCHPWQTNGIDPMIPRWLQSWPSEPRIAPAAKSWSGSFFHKFSQLYLKFSKCTQQSERCTWGNVVTGDTSNSFTSSMQKATHKISCNLSNFDGLHKFACDFGKIACAEHGQHTSFASHPSSAHHNSHGMYIPSW